MSSLANELIEAAMMDYYGNRCDDFDAVCPTCRAWAEYDDLLEQGVRMGLEAAAKACVEQQRVFASDQYAIGQPMSSLSERFACGRCLEEIAALDAAAIARSEP
jgi:hypothetical protein